MAKVMEFQVEIPVQRICDMLSQGYRVWGGGVGIVRKVAKSGRVRYEMTHAGENGEKVCRKFNTTWSAARGYICAIGTGAHVTVSEPE